MTEGLEALDAINEAICDDSGRPLQNIRIRHTIILDDPFPDPAPLLEHIPTAGLCCGEPPPIAASQRLWLRLPDEYAPATLEQCWL